MAVHAPVLHLYQGVHESKMTTQVAPARVVLLFLQCASKDLVCWRHLKSISEAGLVTISEGPLVMAGQSRSLHLAGQPDCARFWSVLLSQKKASMECGTALLDDFMESC